MSWPVVKLGVVCKLVNGDRGKNYPSKDSILSKGIPFINAGNLTKDHSIVCSGANYISEETYNLLSNGKVQQGDILFCLRGSLGKFAIVDSAVPKGAIASSLVIIRPDRRLDEGYLKNYLRSTLCAREITRFENGAAQPNLSAKDLREFEIPLPPVPEQKRIAATLDKADAISRKRHHSIQLADDFLRALFLSMFGDPVINPMGWDVRPLSSGLKSIKAGWSANGESFPCDVGEIGVLKISAVTSGVFKPEENKRVSHEDIPKGKPLIFPKRGDLLFSRANTRELVAATCLVQSDFDNVFLPDKLWKVEASQDQLLPEFLNYLLSHPKFKERLTSQATGSSGSMLNISRGKFEEIGAIFPCVESQKKFKHVYWKVQALVDRMSSSRLKTGDLFDALTQKAFSKVF
ncbi:type I restriction enzyme S subunit [Pseudomonas sp. TE36184]